MWLAERVRELALRVTELELTIRASINSSRARAASSIVRIIIIAE